MPIPWDRPLVHRRGGGSRLGGLDIYYDFDWRTVFRHDRAVFPRGQSLAQLVTEDCPEGKEPTLLLTERTDVEASIEQTEDRYIVIVQINDYLANPGADAATTYYARMSGTPLTQLTTLAEVHFSTAELEGFLSEHLSFEALYRWAADNPKRVDTLRRISSENGERFLPSVAGEIRQLEDADPATLEAIGDYIDRLEDHDIRLLLLRVTGSEAGRLLTTSLLASQLPERIADTRNKLNEYQELIAEPSSTETDVQRFLENNPWIVGLPYVNARARVEIPRGELDFVLDRFDGFFDIVELKGPNDTIVSERQETGASRPPSASTYALGPALAKALAQTHHYRSILDHSRNLSDQYGFSDTRQPWILILLGRSETLSNTGREILRELNLSLHRVEVIPYDMLGLRTEGFLANVEELLSSPNPS